MRGQSCESNSQFQFRDSCRPGSSQAFTPGPWSTESELYVHGCLTCSSVRGHFPTLLLEINVTTFSSVHFKDLKRALLQKCKEDSIQAWERAQQSKPNIQEAQWTLSDLGWCWHPKHWPQNRNKAGVGGPDHVRLKMYYLGLWDPHSGWKQRVWVPLRDRNGGGILVEGRQGPSHQSCHGSGLRSRRRNQGLGQKTLSRGQAPMQDKEAVAWDCETSLWPMWQAWLSLMSLWPLRAPAPLVEPTP